MFRNALVPLSLLLTVLSTVSLLATLPVALSHPVWTTQIPITPGFPYGSQPVRGVNLGGWLVLEVRYQPFPSTSSLTSFIYPYPAVDNAEFVRRNW